MALNSLFSADVPLILTHSLTICQNGLLVPCHKLTCIGQRAFSVATPSVWNSFTDYLLGPTLGLYSFTRQLKTLLLAHC